MAGMSAFLFNFFAVSCSLIDALPLVFLFYAAWQHRKYRQRTAFWANVLPPHTNLFFVVAHITRLSAGIATSVPLPLLWQSIVATALHCFVILVIPKKETDFRFWQWGSATSYFAVILTCLLCGYFSAYIGSENRFVVNALVLLSVLAETAARLWTPWAATLSKSPTSAMSILFWGSQALVDFYTWAYLRYTKSAFFPHMFLAFSVVDALICAGRAKNEKMSVWTKGE